MHTCACGSWPAPSNNRMYFTDKIWEQSSWKLTFAHLIPLKKIHEKEEEILFNARKLHTSFIVSMTFWWARSPLHLYFPHNLSANAAGSLNQTSCLKAFWIKLNVSTHYVVTRLTLSNLWSFRTLKLFWKKQNKTKNTHKKNPKQMYSEMMPFNK